MPQNLQNPSHQYTKPVASFSWSTPSPTSPGVPGNSMGVLRPQQGPTSRTITPDLSRFDALTPSVTQFSQPLQPQSNYNNAIQSLQPQNNYNSMPLQAPPAQSLQTQPSSANWSTATSNPWTQGNISASNPSMPSIATPGTSMSSLSMNRPAMNTPSSFSLPPPPGTPKGSVGTTQQSSLSSAFGGSNQPSVPKPKSGLDAYESLL